MRTTIATLATTMAVGLAAAVPAQAATGLTGHWRFDEASGLTAADSSGRGQTGTLVGPPSWITGSRAGALSFDGDDRVAIPAAGALESATVTVEAWVRNAGSPGAFKYIVAKGASGCIAASYALYTGPSGGLQFYISSGAGTDYVRSPDAGSAVWDGAWHHVAGTFDGDAVRLYVDGEEVGTGTPTEIAIDYASLDSGDLLVGSYGGCGGLEFTGAVDEPKVWSRALSAAELRASAAYEFTGLFAPFDDLPWTSFIPAGRLVPVWFGLNGFQGTDILAAGSPASRPISCRTDAADGQVEDAVPVERTPLAYSRALDRYAFVWKTPKSWAGTCRQLVVSLDDGTSHVASFRFRR